MNYNYFKISIFGNNPIQLDGCKEHILAKIELIKIEKMPVKDSVIIPINDQNHKAVDYVKFLMGKNSNKFYELQKTFADIKIEMPFPEKGDEPIIQIGGLSKSDVDKVNERNEIFRV